MTRLTGAFAVVVLCVAMSPAVALSDCPPLPGDAFAFLALDPPDDRCRPDPIVRWADPHVIFDCSFFADGEHGAHCGDDAAGCVELCERAASTWNTDLTGRFAFVRNDGPRLDFCTSASDGQFDGHTSIGGSTTVCDGSAFGKNVIGVTFRDTLGNGNLVDSDITINSDFAFTPDLFRATVGHELGHVLGLDHPDQCGHDAMVLMRSAFTVPSTDPCFVSEPTADDLRGATMIYPLMSALCGDADQNGSVTVTDAVQVLRAAADLSSVCSLQTCDVDGSGKVTVTDGVAVLRRAAGLSAVSACPQ